VKSIKRVTKLKQVSLKKKVFIATTIMAIALVSVGGMDNSNYNSSTSSSNKYVQVFGSVVKQPVVVYKNQYGIATGNGISIRTGAGIQYSWQGSFALGTKINILGTAGSFYKVSYSGKTGYVSKQFVKITAKPVAIVTPKTVYKNQYGIATGNGISIRTGAGTQYSWQGSFALGTKINILGTAGSFYKVSYSGKTGYVSNQYVKITAKPVVVVTPKTVYKTQYGEVTANGISIRTGAGIQYSWQGSFALGTKINILGTAGSFYKVSYSGKTGYVSNQYVKITAKPVVVISVKVNSVSLNKTTGTLIIGDTDKLTSTVNPVDSTNQDVTWKSSDNTIATVDTTGKVTALKAGTATITVTTVDGSKIATCNVTVNNPIVHPTAVSLNKTSDILTVGDTDTLITTVAPSNTTNNAVTWTSSDASIATVNNVGKVTSIKSGTATITVTTVDGSKIATCNVTVNNPIIKVTSVSLNKTLDILITGDTDNLTTTVAPSNATNNAVTWTSSDKTIANVDTTGKVTSIKAGTATITVTTVDGSKTATCDVTVNDPIKVTSVSLNKTSDDLTVGDVDNLTSVITPNNAVNKNVTWTSSAMSIATVDTTGKVTAVGVGTATITVTTEDGSKIASCVVTVSNPKVASVRLNKTADNLIAGDTDTLTSTVAPNNAENKDVTWTSSNSAVATVDSIGKVTAVSAGIATITATTVDGSKIATCSVTVESLKIESINDINTDIYEGDIYSLPETVSVNMNNKKQESKPVVWTSTSVDTSVVGLKTYEGTVEGFANKIKLNLNVKSIAADLRHTGTSSSKINNTIVGYGITLTSYIPKDINIEKVEVYNNGKLDITYSKDDLRSNNIPTVINANSDWGIAFKFTEANQPTNFHIIVYINNNGHIIPCQYQ